MQATRSKSEFYSTIGAKRSVGCPHLEGLTARFEFKWLSLLNRRWFTLFCS